MGARDIFWFSCRATTRAPIPPPASQAARGEASRQLGSQAIKHPGSRAAWQPSNQATSQAVRGEASSQAAGQPGSQTFKQPSSLTTKQPTDQQTLYRTKKNKNRELPGFMFFSSIQSLGWVELGGIGLDCSPPTEHPPSPPSPLPLPPVPLPPPHLPPPSFPDRPPHCGGGRCPPLLHLLSQPPTYPSPSSPRLPPLLVAGRDPFDPQQGGGKGSRPFRPREQSWGGAPCFCFQCHFNEQFLQLPPQ